MPQWIIYYEFFLLWIINYTMMNSRIIELPDYCVAILFQKQCQEISWAQYLALCGLVAPIFCRPVLCSPFTSLCLFCVIFFKKMFILSPNFCSLLPWKAFRYTAVKVLLQKNIPENCIEKSPAVSTKLWTPFAKPDLNYITWTSPFPCCFCWQFNITCTCQNANINSTMSAVGEMEGRHAGDPKLLKLWRSPYLTFQMRL